MTPAPRLLRGPLCGVPLPLPRYFGSIGRPVLRSEGWWRCRRSWRKLRQRRCSRCGTSAAPSSPSSRHRRQTGHGARRLGRIAYNFPTSPAAPMSGQVRSKGCNQPCTNRRDTRAQNRPTSARTAEPAPETRFSSADAYFRSPVAIVGQKSRPVIKPEARRLLRVVVRPPQGRSAPINRSWPSVRFGQLARSQPHERSGSNYNRRRGVRRRRILSVDQSCR